MEQNSQFQNQIILNVNEDQKKKFLEQCLAQSKKNEMDLKQWVNDVKIVENGYQKNTDIYNCCICQHFAHVPMLCGDCEVAVSCQQCYDQWKNQKGRDKCPLCNKNSAPKPMIKLALQARDKLIVMCTKKGCSKINQEISFEEYLKHVDQCGQKAFYCPQLCGTVIPNFESSDWHYTQCKQTHFECSQCKCLSLQKDFKTHDCLKELLQKVESLTQLQKINERPQDVLVCPCGHQLFEKGPDNNRNQCQGCHNNRINNLKYYRCQQCDFDLCFNCSNKYKDIKQGRVVQNFIPPPFLNRFILNNRGFDGIQDQFQDPEDSDRSFGRQMVD